MTKNRRMFATMAAILILALLLGACGDGSAPASGGNDSGGSAAGDGEVFLIGTFLPLSGGNAAFGVESRNALEMAVEVINDAGGFNGVRVELIPYDVTTPEAAVSVTNRLIEAHGINALIGSMVSSEILAIGQIANDAQVITFGMGTSPTWMEPDWPFVFRAAMNSDRAMGLTADMMLDLDMDRVAVFAGLDDSSIATADSFVAEAAARNIQVVTRESHNTGDTDFSAQIANILASNPHAVFFATMGDVTPNFVRQLRQLGWDGIIINKEAFAVFQAEVAGLENTDHIIWTNPYVTYVSSDLAADIPVMQQFLIQYRERWGEYPQTETSYRAWDSIMSLWEAAKIAPDNSPESLRLAANQVVFEGLGGTLDFTNGDREGYAVFNRFIMLGGNSYLFDSWLADGGYQAFLEATGRDF